MNKTLKGFLIGVIKDGLYNTFIIISYLLMMYYVFGYEMVKISN